MSQKAFIVHDAETNAPIAIGSDRFLCASVGDQGQFLVSFEGCSMEDDEAIICDFSCEIKESPEEVAELLNALS